MNLTLLKGNKFLEVLICPGDVWKSELPFNNDWFAILTHNIYRVLTYTKRNKKANWNPEEARL